MTGPRTPLVHPHRRRGRLLLPFLLVIGLSPLACTGDQPTEVAVPNSAFAVAGHHHPYLMVAASASKAQPSATLRASLSLGVAAVDPAIGPKVLILADADGVSTNALAASVAAAGFQVTTRPAPENTWNGTNPDLTGFAAVIHLDGVTWNVPLPVSAQTALTSFVQNGGGFVAGQWNGYEATVSQTNMPNLVLQTYGFTSTEGECAGSTCHPTYSTVAGQAGHPVVRGIPSPFTFQADGHHAGPMVLFATDPSTVLMQTATGAPAVLVRNFGSGKVVNFSFAPNYGAGGAGATLQDPNIQQLYVNALYWTTGWSPVQAQTITFAALADKTFGDPAFTVAATASSGLPVSFTVAGTCSISETTVTLTGAGSCAVTAHQAGNTGFNPADDVTQSFSIAKASATITVGTEFVFDGTAKASEITTNPAGLSGVTVTYTQNGSPVADPTSAGTYQVVARLNNPDYQAQDATGTLTIRQAVPTIQWSPSSLAIGGALGIGQLNATATGVGGGSVGGNFSYTPPAGTRLSMATPVTAQFKSSDPNYTDATKTVAIAVAYDFSGFFLPVKNPPVVNLARAGQTIALKFSLGGYQGTGILAAGSPSSSSTPCLAGTSVTRVDDEDEDGNSGLRASGGRYTYYWKTDLDWAGSCRTFVLKLTDGTTHVALFSFAAKPVGTAALRKGKGGRDNDDHDGNRQNGPNNRNHDH
ncbi:MAG TPA: PxKF domain-containing protein [Gemmatimonadales bacterium]|jgi:hypothetical protein|nr:PxKF domain-containing protein [Gemmatimonadales bacterium]